jgi:acyl-CoA thioesterase
MAEDLAPIDAANLLARDAFASGLGLVHVDSAPGRVRVRLTVGEAHLNFNGACHGGVVFALADSAFGFCCNAGGTLSVAIDAMVTYTKPVWPGDVLEAEAVEITRTKRVGSYRAEVRRGDGEIVATFAATAYVTGKAVPVEIGESGN